MMKTSVEELEANIKHLRGLLDEANEMRSHLMAQHLDTCKSIANLSRTITAVLSQANGEIFISSECFIDAVGAKPFTLGEVQDGYLLTLEQ